MNDLFTINDKEIENDMVIISINKHRKVCRKKVLELLNNEKKFEKKIKDYFLHNKIHLNNLINKIIDEDIKDPVTAIIDLYYE